MLMQYEWQIVWLNEALFTHRYSPPWLAIQLAGWNLWQSDLSQGTRDLSPLTLGDGYPMWWHSGEWTEGALRTWIWQRKGNSFLRICFYYTGIYHCLVVFIVSLSSTAAKTKHLALTEVCSNIFTRSSSCHALYLLGDKTKFLAFSKFYATPTNV